MHRVREGEEELDRVRVPDGKLTQARMQRYEGRAVRLQPFRHLRRPGGDLDLRQHEHDGLLALRMAHGHRLSLLGALVDIELAHEFEVLEVR